MIDGPIDTNGVWRTRYNSEIYRLCDEPEVVR